LPNSHSRAPPPGRITAAALATVLIGLAGCGQPQSPPAPQASATAPPPAPTAVRAPRTPAGPPQPTFTLILTWLAPNQPPATSQTVFHDAATCAHARDAALAEGQRLATDAATSFAAANQKFQAGEHRYVGQTLLSGDAAPTPPAVPKVAAFCASS
jgi:hypothetical protein